MTWGANDSPGHIQLNFLQRLGYFIPVDKDRHVPLAAPPLDRSAPLMLWCSSHPTLAAEEIPLLLQAGFRVVPLLTDFWTYRYQPELASQICDCWKDTVGLPQEVVHQLQSLNLCENEGQGELNAEQLRLLNQHVDAIYMTVLPNLAIRLAQVYRGTVMFRIFGHGDLTTYTRIALHYRADLSALERLTNYMWVPILTTLGEVEDPRLTNVSQHLGAFVTPKRLGTQRWHADSSQPYVVETIPRIGKQDYYLNMYRQYRQDHGQLPLKILGGNEPRGGQLDDPSIVGFLPDEQYYGLAASARLSIYHGKSRFHLHYHPIEFMALGVPVLFHHQSAIAAEGQQFGLSLQQLEAAGMYRTVEQANEMATAALQDVALAAQWSESQRIFLSEVFSRDKALDQARWLRSRVQQLKPWLAQHWSTLHPLSTSSTTSPEAGCLPTSGTSSSSIDVVKPKRPIPQRVARELRRFVSRRLKSA